MKWAQRFRRHWITLCQGDRTVATVGVWIGDTATISDEVSTFAVVEVIDDRHVRITIRTDDERLTAADLDLLREQPPVPA